MSDPLRRGIALELLEKRDVSQTLRSAETSRFREGMRLRNSTRMVSLHHTDQDTKEGSDERTDGLAAGG